MADDRLMILPVASDDGNADELHHLWCCDPNVAMCGDGLSDDVEADEPLSGEIECPTCFIVDDMLACPLCGSYWVEFEERYSDE